MDTCLACIYCARRFEHKGGKTLHELKCRLQCDIKVSCTRSKRANAEYEVEEQRAKKFQRLQPEGLNLPEDIIHDYASVDNEVVYHEVYNAVEHHAVYDTDEDLIVDASLLFYQKSIESLYENGLGLIEHHKVASKVKTTTGDYIAGNRKGLPLLGNFLHGTSEIIKS